MKLLKIPNRKSSKGKLSYILLVLLFLSSQLFASAKGSIPAYTVKGQVTSATGETLVGVSIKVKESATGTSTDVNGKCSISVPDNKSNLVFRTSALKPKKLLLMARKR